LPYEADRENHQGVLCVFLLHIQFTTTQYFKLIK